MFKLPRCPYCGCSYSYASIKKNKNSKTCRCISCKKVFSVKYKATAVKFALAMFVVLILINTLVLKFTKSLTIWPNLFMTVIFIIIFLCLIPYTVKFGKIEGQEIPEKLKKNRHRYKKDKETEDIENPLKNTTFDK